MNYFLGLIIFVMLPLSLYQCHQEGEVVSTKEIGVVEAVSGGTWTTRVQAGGINYPLAGEITVASGTKVVLQQRATDSLYMCDAATKTKCFKVRSSESELGQQSPQPK